MASGLGRGHSFTRIRKAMFVVVFYYTHAPLERKGGWARFFENCEDLWRVSKRASSMWTWPGWRGGRVEGKGGENHDGMNNNHGRSTAIKAV
jgi:hypothetical protein